MSFSEWKEVKLDDVAGYVTEKILITEINLENYVSTENLIADIGGLDTASGLPNVSKMNKFEKNDILISNIRPYFKKIWLAKQNGGCSNDVLVLEANDKVDSTYLYYNLACDEFFNYVMSGAKGTKMPRGDKKHILNYSIYLPEFQEQKSIANILSNLDEKIEVNNVINKTLEEMAQAIFKQWFVDFEFPNEDGEPYKSSGGEMVESELGMIPKGWEVGSIGDYVKVKSGYAFKSSWWETQGVPVIKIKDIENRTVNFKDVSFVSQDKVDNARDFIVKGGELLIAMTGATIGKFAIVPSLQSFALVNQRVGKFFLGDTPFENVGFIYCVLNQDDIYNEIVSRGDGSAQPNISPSGIETIKIILPKNSLINRFNKLVCANYRRIADNIYENERLIELRNTLLPKLMSGEIRIPLNE